MCVGVGYEPVAQCRTSLCCLYLAIAEYADDVLLVIAICASSDGDVSLKWDLFRFI